VPAAAKGGVITVNFSGAAVLTTRTHPRCSRHRTVDVSLDNAFALIEGHPPEAKETLSHPPGAPSGMSKAGPRG
jgi:hypothetical protein